MTEQDVVRRMLQQGGAKPTATEYMLQQVIFVVPASERGNMAKRKREAEAMRARFNGCDNTREFAKGLARRDGHAISAASLAPELPPDWAEQIKNTKVGGATGVRETAAASSSSASAPAARFPTTASPSWSSRPRAPRATRSGRGTRARSTLAELREKAKIVKR